MRLRSLLPLPAWCLPAVFAGACAANVAQTSPPAAAPRQTIRTVALVAQSHGRPVTGARCTLSDTTGPHTGTTNADGYVAWGDVTTALRATHVQCQADGYANFSEHRDLTTDGNEDLASVELLALRPNAGEVGGFRVFGQVFQRNADGSRFPWVGVSEFRLFEVFVREGQPAVDAILTDLLTKPDGSFYPPAEGPNILRVFGMYSCQRDGAGCVPNTGIGWFTPTEHPDYYDKLGAFVDVVAARGFNVEFVALADTQNLMTRAEDRGAHLEKVAGVLTSKARGAIEVANEPFKNLPGGGAEACALAARIRGRGIPIASGHYDFDDEAQRCLADYITYHSPRKPEWVRTSKDLQDIRDWAKVPVVGDEPPGFAEIERGDSRRTSPIEAAQHAAGCALFGAGCTFHSDAGIQSAQFGPVQRAALEAWIFGARWVPVRAQTDPYQRGDQGGCHWVGTNDPPAEHDDARWLRSFSKGTATEQWLVQPALVGDTQQPPAIPCPGWTVADNPRPGLTRLVRQ